MAGSGEGDDSDPLLPALEPPIAGRPVGPPSRRALRIEVVLLLGLSLGMSALYAATNLIDDLTKAIPLKQQQATLNVSQSSRHIFDLVYQLLGITGSVLPALLAVYLLARTGRPPAAIGIDRREPRRDAGRGAILAAIIGIPGLGLYLAAHALGISLDVVPSNLPHVWWREPVLVLSAVQNAVLEEVVVVGYLLTRLRELRWRPERALLASAALRGSYHLYQGFGGFIGNAIMGLIFGYFFQRTRRVLPLVIAHSILDIVSFVGYTLLADRVGWI